MSSAPLRRWRRRWPAPLLSVCLAATAGCGGSARLELVSLNYRAIDPPAPQAARLALDHCWWWTDADGRVWVAMQTQRRSPLGRYGHFEFQLSLALDEPPAGRARNYRITRRSLRARARVGPIESRFTSTAGIVAVYREPGERLRGSFRIATRRQVSRLLGGWSRPARYLIQGTFQAVHDEARGRPVAELTESHGWERPPPGGARRAGTVTTAPARNPPAPPPSSP